MRIKCENTYKNPHYRANVHKWIQPSLLWARAGKGRRNGMVSSNCKHLKKLSSSLWLRVCQCVCRGMRTLGSSFPPSIFMHTPLRVTGLQQEQAPLPAESPHWSSHGNPLLWRPNLRTSCSTHIWPKAKPTVSHLFYVWPLTHVSLFLNLLTFLLTQNVSAFALSLLFKTHSPGSLGPRVSNKHVWAQPAQHIPLKKKKKTSC